MPRVKSAAAVYIGSRMSALRRERQMTVDQLAVASSIDSANIRSYESGRSLMSLLSLMRIANGLGVAPAELLDGVTLDMFPERG